MALALRSKTGCLRCRRRRIKCDESRPICLRCQKNGLACIWQGSPSVTPQYMQSTTALGNLYASLFLQLEFREYDVSHSLHTIRPCPATSISDGFPPFRNDEEHRSLVQLGGFLDMLEHTPNREEGSRFEFSVALQEVWVRDALLAFATLVGGQQPPHDMWKKVAAYYKSADNAVRHYISDDLDEWRLEQFLVVSFFLGMIEFNRTFDEISPLPHVEATGRVLEALHKRHGGRVLPMRMERFHRIVLEAYLYFIAIESLFGSQTDHYPILTALHGSKYDNLDNASGTNIVAKLDLRIYVFLFKLARFSRFRIFSDNQRRELTQLDQHIRSLDSMASIKLQGAIATDSLNDVAFYKMTRVATSTMQILSAKVTDRSLLAASPRLRPLVETALSRLEGCQTLRNWTGDLVWVFTILACAVNTPTECDRFSVKLQELMGGFWGADFKRMKKVLEKVRLVRTAFVNAQPATEEDAVAYDTLGLLVDSRLS